MTKLSIIIPAYNAEEYIENCLLSCISQDLEVKDYEILVVNDGSKDNTETLVNNYATAHANIVQIFQENKGNGAARNTGVENAKGEYIYFLDADDYIAHNTLGKLIGLVLENDLDLLGFSSINVTDSEKKIPSQNPKEVAMDAVLSGIGFLASYNYKAEVWWYLIKKSFYTKSGVTFYDRKFVQDSYLTPTLFSNADRAAFINLDVHRYRKSPNSITRRKTPEHLNRHFKDLSFSITSLYNLRKELEDRKVNPMALRRLHAKQQRYVFIVIVRFIKSGLPTTQLKVMLSEYKNLEAYPMDKFMSVPDYRSLTYRILTSLFNKEQILYSIISLYRRVNLS